MKGLQRKLYRQEKELLESMIPCVQIIDKPCNFGGKRYLFVCPQCKHTVYTLYEDPVWGLLTCQRCSAYSYPKQRFKGMLEGGIYK